MTSHLIGASDYELVADCSITGMTKINDCRLYWVYISSVINSGLSFLESDLPNATNALNIMSSISFYTGILSWALYYARFSVNLSLLLKNTIKGSWVSEEDKKLPWWNLSTQERLLIEWDKRKFSLLNDSLWATCNLICYFWLRGSGTLGQLGSVLNIVFLAYDVSASIWVYKDKLDKHQEDIKSLSNCTKYEIDQCNNNWKYEQYRLYNNIGYATARLAVFALMTLPFLPVAAPSMLIIALTGSLLCLSFAILHDLIELGIKEEKKEEDKLIAKTAKCSKTVDASYKFSSDKGLSLFPNRMKDNDETSPINDYSTGDTNNMYFN